eukprot:TRINITY_DN1825_c0_g1_i1.p1 TRINITY_DN1825_c0_g1~~TRINITY_DN1825_c0_g1_i1.p1  ORF type:complete len:225 (-),score=26.79 TRINITY_DN1825_c0_g1_i1:426-1100(-)
MAALLLWQNWTTMRNVNITQEVHRTMEGAVDFQMGLQVPIQSGAQRPCDDQAPWSLYADSKGKMGIIGLGKRHPGAQLSVRMRCAAPAEGHPTKVTILYLKSYEHVGAVRILPKSAKPFAQQLASLNGSGAQIIDALDTSIRTSTSAVRQAHFGDAYVTTSSVLEDGRRVNDVEFVIELLGPDDAEYIADTAGTKSQDVLEGNGRSGVGDRGEWKFKILQLSCC